MSIGVRVSGAWKDVNAVSARVGGAWEPVSQAYVKVSDVWKELLSAVTPNMVVTDLGTFTGTRSSNTITYSSLPDTSAYPEVLALPSWRRDSDGSRGLNAITFGGNAGVILSQ